MAHTWRGVGASTHVRTRDGSTCLAERILTEFQFQRQLSWVVTLTVGSDVLLFKGGSGGRLRTEMQCYLGSRLFRLGTSALLSSRKIVFAL